MKVLVVEDEPDMAESLRWGLEAEGYVVDVAENGEEGLWKAQETGHDVIILDVMLPGLDGFQICSRLRAEDLWTPILMLTAMDDDLDLAEGLDVGADDYLPKPFSFEELIARLRSLLRRQSSAKQTLLEHRGIELDLLGRTVRVNAKPVDLTSREYALLEIFMQNPGRILTRTLISEKIWASNYDVDTNLLDVYMSRLRTKLETAHGTPLFKTVRGVGYQLL
jgi:DNA-binding response OmpR family regulator